MTHPNAKMASTTNRGDGGERESDLEHLVRRLALLGATEEEITAVRDNWDNDGDGWNAEIAHNFAGISDGRLVEALRSIREEYPYEPAGDADLGGEDHHDNPEGVAMGLYPGALPAGAPAGSTETAGDSPEGSSNGQDGTDQGSDPENGSDGGSEGNGITTGNGAHVWTFDLGATVPELLEAVGTDPAKAQAVLTAELATGDPRKTLVEPLRHIVGG